MGLKPISRLENFLARIGGDTTVEPIEPLSRFEKFLNQIAVHIQTIAEKASKTSYLVVYVNSFDSNGNGYQDRSKTPFQSSILYDIDNYREIRVKTVDSVAGHGHYYIVNGVAFNFDGRIQERHLTVMVSVPDQNGTFVSRAYTLYRGSTT